MPLDLKKFFKSWPFVDRDEDEVRDKAIDTGFNVGGDPYDPTFFDLCAACGYPNARVGQYAGGGKCANPDDDHQFLAKA